MAGQTQESLQRMLADVIITGLPLHAVQTVLDAGAHADGVVVKGLRPLHYAASEDNAAAINELVLRGAGVNNEDHVGYTPLHIACKHGLLDSVQALLRANAVINFSETDQNISDSSRILASLTLSPMNLAIENNHITCLRLLLENGGNPNQPYFLGSELNLVPLENLGCLELLLQHGADPDSYGRSGLTVLMKACKQQDPAVVRLLLLYGAQVNLQCPPRFEQKTALHFAALSGNVDIVGLLLEGGAHTGVMEGYRHTPLELAITQDKCGVVYALLGHGADVNALNAEGCSPLQVACASFGLKHAVAITELLLSHGAKPNHACKYFSYVSPSLSPLVEYLSYNSDFDRDMIAVLLRYGARVSLCRAVNGLKVQDGAGILGHARKLRRDEDIMKMLLEAAGSYDITAIREEVSLSARQREVFLQAATAPRSLKHKGRLTIRSSLRLPLPTHAGLLPLPPLLKEYVKLCNRT